jgi:CBS domain-containing protein
MGPVVSVESNLSVYDTILQIFAKDVGTIFITEGENLVGIVSRKDLLKIAIGKTDINKVPINVIMTRMPNIIYCEENDEIVEVVKKLIEHQIDSLPVLKIKEVRGKKVYKIVGRVTKTNITKLFLENFEK